MGKRGEVWVALQLALFVLILLAPEVESFPLPLEARIVGVALLCLGGAVGTLGVMALGSNLTPFPKPKEGGFLVSSGIYGIVRHPIYAGLILGTLGWSLITDTLLGIVLSLALLVFFDIKSRREELWLREAYPDYADYQKRVRKLIPFIY